MLHYTFSIKQSFLVSIKLELETTEDSLILTLPTWRPGRYEEANFAQYIRNLCVYNESREELYCSKNSPNSWYLDTSSTKTVSIEYEFWANKLDAGNTYCDENQLYVNPVNCCLFRQNKQLESVTIQLQVPNDWKIASAIPFDPTHSAKVESIEKLFDSPFIASASLQHDHYNVNGISFFIWFQGECKPDFEKLKHDFYAFTKKQLDAFGHFPVKTFHFLFQISPYRNYHGVEHLDSTVISLGPGCKLMQAPLYNHLLEVSSHELYHVWNAKSIRDAEMYPYKFTQQNLFQTGYIIEGITTYFGDHFLYTSGIYTLKEYIPLLQKAFQQHSDNAARKFTSMADSSMDLWIDGYKKGMPNRRLSIYSDGTILALIADLFLIQQTNGEINLTLVMKYLYENFALKHKGITGTNYKEALELLSGKSFNWYFELIHQKESYLETLAPLLQGIGLELVPSKSSLAQESFWGIKTSAQNTITVIFPNSPADKCDLQVDDEIVSINGIEPQENLSDWVSYFEGKVILILKRKHQTIEKQLMKNEVNWFPLWKCHHVEFKTSNQQLFFETWSK